MKKSTTLLSTAAAAGALAFGVAGVLGQSATAASSATPPDASFVMPRSATARVADCLPDAKAQVKITKLGNVEQMVVSAHGLAPNTEYDLFVIQAANAFMLAEDWEMIFFAFQDYMYCDVAIRRRGTAPAVDRAAMLERENRALRAEIDALRGSTSWLMTAPLRSLSRKLRPVKRR